MTDRTLFVLLGAGASYDASTWYDGPLLPWTELRPPLVKELFGRRFSEILDHYPLARNAAPAITDAMSGDEEEPAQSLEDFIRKRYRDSDDPYNQRRFWSLAPYLQDVLFKVSRPDLYPDNLYRLVNPLLDHFDHVCFVTLNYDVLLDRCLSDLNPLATLEDFIRYPRWSLIKLHGSITWGHPLHEPADLNSPPPNLADLIDTSKIYHRFQVNSETLRRIITQSGTIDLYPALSVPLGPDDEIVCPAEHTAFLVNRLADVGDVDLLVVGYSGLDRTVLDLFAENVKRFRTVYIVNADAKTAREVAGRMSQALKVGLTTNISDVSEASFGEWARFGPSRYLQWLDQRR